MLRTRILMIVISGIVIWLIFLLPKVVVDNESELSSDTVTRGDSLPEAVNVHTQTSPELRQRISSLRAKYQAIKEKEKSAIFADSLASRYNEAGKFDSAAWFAEEAAMFFNNAESWAKVGDQYYQAYTFALDQTRQKQMAESAREFYQKALDEDPSNLDVKTKMAMTYLSSSSPMQGIMMLQEVLVADPQNEGALFNMGMLSIQSGQYDKAIERFEDLVKINPSHIQGQLLLGVAYMNAGDRKKAKTQFEKVKELDTDPSVQATVDSYLKDLK